MIVSSAQFSRRRIIQAAALAPLAAAAASAANFDPEDPRALLAAFQKLRFSLRPEPVYWWLRVSKHGVVDGELTHLYDMEIASIFQAQPRDDGFSVTSLELIYTVDTQTGELIDELKNPYTGELLPWSHTPVGPTTVNYSSTGLELPTELPGVKIRMTSALNSGMVHAGQVWLKDDNAAVVTQLEGDEPPFLVNDWSTYLGDVADLENPDLEQRSGERGFSVHHQLAETAAHGPPARQHDQSRCRGQGSALCRPACAASATDCASASRDCR